jgi:HlyD family secretion protein
VQPFRTSIVSHVPVRAGEVVTRGALLAELDATFSEADRKQLEVLVLSLAAEIGRLRAELAGEAYRPSAENEYTQLQLRIADQRRAERDAKVAELDMKIAEAEAGERATAEKLQFLHTQQDALETLRSGRQELLARGVASQAQYLDLVQQEAKIRGEVADAEGEQKRFAKRREQAAAEKASFLATWAVEGQQRLVSAEREHIQKAQDLEKALKVKDLDVVTAATDAVVLEVAQRSGGSVLNTGETLMTLVPIDGALEVEAEVLSRDVGWIKVGQEVRLKLDTLPFHRHGLLYGRVRALSPDGLPKQSPSSSQRADLRPENGADVWVHRVYITIERDELHGRPEAFRLLPGMTVRTEFIVGDRTVLSYLMDPLMEGLDRSLKEPR